MKLFPIKFTEINNELETFEGAGKDMFRNLETSKLKCIIAYYHKNHKFISRFRRIGSAFEQQNFQLYLANRACCLHLKALLNHYLSNILNVSGSHNVS